MGTAAVQPLIRDPAHTGGGDMPFDFMIAISATRAQGHAAIIDDLGIREADRNVISGRSKLLEVRRLANPHERIVGFLTIERVGLHPFLAAGNAVGTWVGDNAVPSLLEVLHDRLSGQRRQSLAIRLIRRAGNDHAHNAILCIVP